MNTPTDYPPNLTQENAVLVSSCDSYADIWQPFFQFFFKYWPDCPYPLYLMSNYKIYEDERVITLNVNKKTTWSDELQSALDMIPAKRILYLQDDFFFNKTANTEWIEKLFEKAEKHDAAYIKLIASVAKNQPFDNELESIPEYVLYRTVLQSALWKKQDLLSLLLPHENIWQFELNASIRSRMMSSHFLAIKSGLLSYPISYYITAVVKGKVRYPARKLCEAHGIKLNTQARPVESYGEYMLYELKSRLYRLKIMVINLFRFISSSSTR